MFLIIKQLKTLMEIFVISKLFKQQQQQNNKNNIHVSLI
jgi:hypothetical protein